LRSNSFSIGLSAFPYNGSRFCFVNTSLSAPFRFSSLRWPTAAVTHRQEETLAAAAEADSPTTWTWTTTPALKTTTRSTTHGTTKHNTTRALAATHNQIHSHGHTLHQDARTTLSTHHTTTHHNATPIHHTTNTTTDATLDASPKVPATKNYSTRTQSLRTPSRC